MAPGQDVRGEVAARVPPPAGESVRVDDGICGPAEHGEVAIEWRLFLVKVGFGECEVGSDDAKHDLHEFSIVQYLRRSSVEPCQALQLHVVRSVMDGRGRWASVGRRRARYEQMVRPVAAKLSQSARQFERNQRAQAVA